jgi:hypothetical protein
MMGKSYNVKSHSFLNSPPVVTIAPTQSHASIVLSDSRQVNLTMLNHIHFLPDENRLRRCWHETVSGLLLPQGESSEMNVI